MAGKSAERVYVVENTGAGAKRLVQAKSQAAALTHVVNNTFDVRAVGTVEMGELICKYRINLEFAGTRPDPAPSALPGGKDLVGTAEATNAVIGPDDAGHMDPTAALTDPRSGDPI